SNPHSYHDSCRLETVSMLVWRHQGVAAAASQISLGEKRRPRPIRSRRHRQSHAWSRVQNGDGIKMFATLKRVLPGFAPPVASANGETAFVPIQLAYGQSGTDGARPEAISGGSRDAWIFQGCGRQMRLQHIRTRQTFAAGHPRFDGLTDN